MRKGYGPKRGALPRKRQILFYALAVGLFLLLAYITSSSISSSRTSTPFATTTISNNLVATSIQNNGSSSNAQAANANQVALSILEQSVLPAQGFTLNAKWGGAVKQLVDSGALNVTYLYIALNRSNQPITLAERQILNGTYNGSITMNRSNTEFMVLVLWGLGINNRNPIINDGPLMNTSINGGRPDGFASTGGYGPLGTLQLGKLAIINLTPAQQAIANYTAKNAYRPCCNNPISFPDCNHGAAPLGLIELMASQGASQQEIFSAVEEFNSLQFPQQYLYTAEYFASKNISWANVSPQVVLGKNFSSATGAAETLKYLRSNNIVPPAPSGNGSCGA